MLYLFDKNENLIHELASSELESLIQHEELNKLMTLEFAVFIDSNDKMKDIEYVAHKDMEDYQKIQMYRIISSESDDYTVNYQAVHIIFDELKSYGYIRDKRPDKVKASAALNIALAGSRWKVGKVDDSDLLSANFYDLTRLDALSKIIKTWNLDLHFYLTFDGNKITGRYVDLLEFRGEDTGERFVYGSNALEVVKEVDVSEVYTRIIPRGKGEEKIDEEGKPTDGYGRRIKIDDVVWEKSKGDPIDKPKGQEYIELKEMTERFGFSDGEARTRVQIFEDIEDPKELIKAGYDFLVNVSRPLVQFKTKISKKSRTNVGDVVRIIRKDLDFYYRTRIYKAHRNLLNETLEVEFGDKLVQSPADRQKIVSDSLNSLEERIKETETDLKSSFVDKVNEGITHATFNRDGYNYELKKGNKYGLPAGYYSFDREIDDNPQKVIYVGAGTLAIADSKKSNGDWNFRTFGTGKGFTADLIVAGIILGGKVRWNLEDGTFIIGNSPSDYSLYWDGSTLHLRNVDIDLKNNRTIQDLKEKQGLSEKEIADHKRELEEANEKLDKARNDLNLAKNEITNLSNDFTLSNIEQDKTNKIVEEKILDLSTSLNITDEKIESTAESIRKATEKSINDMGSETKQDIKTYLLHNYSSSIQTDQKIENQVGQLKTLINSDINNLNKEIEESFTKIVQDANQVWYNIERIKKRVNEDSQFNYDRAERLSTDIKIIAGQVSSTVKENEVISAINQTAEQIKIQANKINFEGSTIDAKGTFRTLNGVGESGVEIKYNNISFKDNRWDGKTFGNISVARLKGTDALGMVIGHYQTSHLGISYWSNDAQAYYDYVTFDRWNYTGRRKDFPITFNEKTHFKDTVRMEGKLHFDKARLQPYTNGLAMENYSGNGLVVTDSGEVWIKKGGKITKRLDN